MEMTSVAERRRQPRIGLRYPLGFREVAAHPPVVHRGVTLDVSRTGLRFRTDSFLPAGAFLFVELSLPGRGMHASGARTVWVRQSPSAGHWEVGTQFVRQSGDADALLAETLLLGA